MTYDWADHYDLVFGGFGSSDQLNGTWTYANGTWTNITSTAGDAPPAQNGFHLAYDWRDGYVLGWGCPSSNPNATTFCDDTWSFLHGKWSKISATVVASSGGWNGMIPTAPSSAMMYDAADGYILLVGSSSYATVATWEYAGGVWSPFCAQPTNCTQGPIVGPSEGSLAASAYDASDGYVVAYGAYGTPVNLKPITWKFSAGVWSNLTGSVGTPPPPRGSTVMVSDNSTGGTILFGGCNIESCYNDTWEFQDGAWQDVTTTPSPPDGFAYVGAYVPADASVVVYSATLSAGQTWMWGDDPPIAGLSIHVTPPVPRPQSGASFDAFYLGGVGTFSFSWRFGDGNSSAEVNPVHVYANNGSYIVRLWVNDSSGHSANASLVLEVATPLSVTLLQAAPNPALLGQPVNFTAGASGGTPPYTFAWSFGDGGTGGNLSDITHVYTTNGPFEVEVSVSDAPGTVVHAFLNISIKLEALAGSSSTSGTSPLTVSFVGQAQGGAPPYSFLWSFGDGGTSTLQNPRHTYNSTGQFSVLLTIVDSRGNRSTSSLLIDVHGTAPLSLVTTGWFDAIVVVAAVAGVAILLGVSAVRIRTQRREAQQWIQELTDQGPAQEPRSPGPK